MSNEKSEKIVRKMTVNELFSVTRAVDELVASAVKYPIGVAWKISRLCKELSEVSSYVYSQLCERIEGFGNSGFGNDSFGSDYMTESQKIAYAAVMMSEIDVDLTPISKEELLDSGDNVMMSPHTVELLMKVVE